MKIKFGIRITFSIDLRIIKYKHIYHEDKYMG
jgi:hypothetical protein